MTVTREIPMGMPSTQVQLIPFSELSPGQAAKIRNDIIQALVAKAVKELNKPPGLLVVRDILPKTDLDFTNEDWCEVTGSSSAVWETMSSGTMGDERYVGIYGIKADPDAFACSAIKFNIGGADKAIWLLQSLREYDDMVGLCPSGIIIPQNNTYTISRYVLYTLSSSCLILKGVVVEPRGKVISP